MTDPLNLLIKLTPRLDRKPWGGRRLERFGLALPGSDPIGEAVITAGDAHVAGGELAGATVQDLVDRDPERVVGPRGLAATGGKPLFPLLVKLIDARRDLSIQVHPDDQGAAPLGALGKTETYHVLASEPGSRIALGLRPGVTAGEFAAACRDGARTAPLLRWLPARLAESILIPAGTIHALGAGCLVFEAQQPSELTYRLDDWGRLDTNGRPRELHLEAGLAAFDPGSRPPSIAPLALRGAAGRRHLLTACRYFAVERIALARGETVTVTTSGSPQTLTALRGAVTVGVTGGPTTLACGETGLVSAAAGTAAITAEAPAVLLRTWVPDLPREIVAPALASGHDESAVATLADALPDIAHAIRELVSFRG